MPSAPASRRTGSSSDGPVAWSGHGPDRRPPRSRADVLLRVLPAEDRRRAAQPGPHHRRAGAARAQLRLGDLRRGRQHPPAHPRGRGLGPQGDRRSPPMAHLTCQGHAASEIAQILESYRDAGIENILALGGDQPQDGRRRPAERLPLRQRAGRRRPRRRGHFTVGVAAHPEVHPRSRGPRRPTGATWPPSCDSADFAITQFFFERRALGPPRRRAGRARGAPSRCSRASCRSPTRARSRAWPSCRARPSRAGWPSGSRRRATRRRSAGSGWRRPPSCARELLDAGAPGLHFYTLNRSTATREIYANLGLPVTQPERRCDLGLSGPARVPPSRQLGP